MPRKPLDWEKRNRAAKTGREEIERRQGIMSLNDDLDASQHDLDVARLERLLKSPKIHDRDRERIKASLDWLAENRTRTIWPNNPHRHIFEGIARRASMLRRGIDMDTPESKARRAQAAKEHRRRSRLRQIQREEEKAKIIKKSPSELPKKPPGR